MQDDRVAVTQADRDAASAYYVEYMGAGPNFASYVRALATGNTNALVLAFAAHRIATAEACARIAEGEMFEPDDDGYLDREDSAHNQALSDAATAIRLQQGSEKP